MCHILSWCLIMIGALSHILILIPEMITAFDFATLLVLCVQKTGNNVWFFWFTFLRLAETTAGNKFA